MLNKRQRSKLLFCLRLAFGVILLLVFLKIVDIDRVKLVLASARLHLIGVAIAGMIMNCFLMTYRWACLLWIQKPNIPFSQLLRFYFISGFLGGFLPTSMSSDFLRIYYTSRRTSDPKGVLSSVVVDRIIGSFSAAIIALMGFIVLQLTDPVQIGSVIPFEVLAFLFLCIGVPLALQNAAVVGTTTELLRRFAGRKWHKKVLNICDSFLLYQNHGALMMKVLLISFLSHTLAILVFYIIAKGFSAEISIMYFFLFIPLAGFVTMLPVSVGGIGIFEGAIVFLFSRAGMSPEMCLSISLVNRALLLIATLPGGVMYLLTGLSRKELIHNA